MHESNNMSLIAQIKARLFGGEGQSSLELRQSIREKVQQEVLVGKSEPLEADVLNGYIEKLSRNAYQITGEDLAGLSAAGYSEDEVFEMTVSGAFTAGTTRLGKVLELLKEEI